MKKVNFKNLMITLAYLRKNVMGEFFKDIRIKVCRDDDVIKIYTTQAWNANRIVSKHPGDRIKSYYDPLYEIRVYDRINSKYIHEFSAIIPCHNQSNQTGLWDKYEFPMVDKIEDCIFQIIKFNLTNYYEHLAEIEIGREYRTPASHCSSCGVLETIVRPGKTQCDNPECSSNK